MVCPKVAKWVGGALPLTPQGSRGLQGTVRATGGAAIAQVPPTAIPIGGVWSQSGAASRVPLPVAQRLQSYADLDSERAQRELEANGEGGNDNNAADFVWTCGGFWDADYTTCSHRLTAPTSAPNFPLWAVGRS